MVTVDSSSPGYHADVLTDRRWIAKGEEKALAFGNLDRLGNGNNTWASSETNGEHWVSLEWPQPVALDEVEIWWSLAEWYPRAFRIERRENDRWLPVGEGDGWLVPTDRQSVIPLPKIETRALRIFQPDIGASRRGFFGAQEVLILNRDGKTRPLAGARRLSPEAFARLEAGQSLEHIARLNDVSPGAASLLRWEASGRSNSVAALADGNLDASATKLGAGQAVGLQWPVRHSIDRVKLVFPATPPVAAGLVLEVDDGARWIPVKAGLKCRTLAAEGSVEWTFEPTVTRAVRVRVAKAPRKIAVAELQVFRFMPRTKDAWPARLVEKVGLKQEILASLEEPSFEALALNAHSMQSARAFVGLKDEIAETGVAWDGALVGRETIRFRFGAEQLALGEYADTLRRTLLDGWRPCVVVEGRMGEQAVRQTVFAAPMGERARPVVFVRFSIRNLSDKLLRKSVQAVIAGERPGVVSFQNGVLKRGNDPILLALPPSTVGDSADSMNVSFTLQPGEERHVDFIHPQDTNAPLAELTALRGASFGQALAEFRRYWDNIMATPTVLEVPEPRINRAVRAVLAQCFVCGDGNIMPYGATPSCYEGALFGIEESYPMLGLAMFGYAKDAQRYLDGTYLTRKFLQKVEDYSVKQSEFRHQQYRNGLQPHYAVSAWRLSRDEAWIRGHLSLLKECAEWTMTQRRRTMELEGGQKPLHWGLLPKWAYGGDIYDVLCYPIFPNLCCWRGLTDTAWLLDELGEKETAQRYRDDARDFRAAIDRAIEGTYLKDQQPPFLPLRLYATKPDEQKDFYQLFAGCLLDVEAFAPGSSHARWITDYLEESNRVFCHLPRFRHMGEGALDAIYGKGYFLTLLHEDSIRDFLLAFYAYLAFNMEHETFVSRESNVLYPSDVHARSAFHAGAFPAGEITDPLVCGSAVFLHLVRHMLVTEERGAAAEYSGNLLLLAGTPRAWLQEAKTIRLREAPTHFGPLSLEVLSHTDKKRIEATLTPPKRNACHTIKLRLRHPDGQPMRSVLVNGRAWLEFDSVKEWILLPGNVGDCSIEVRY